jgi:hypothetical protein
MARTDGARRSAGARRAGYLLAIGFSTVLLVILNGRPGWQAIPFLTNDTGQVLGLVNLSLAAGSQPTSCTWSATRRGSDRWATW